MSDIVGIVLFSFAILYLVFGTGCASYYQTMVNYRKRNDETPKGEEEFLLEGFSPVPNRLDESPCLRDKKLNSDMKRNKMKE